MFNWLRNQLGRRRRGLPIAPQARMTDKCAKCGRLPEIWEEPFRIHVLPVCDDCFWDDDFPEWQEQKAVELGLEKVTF